MDEKLLQEQHISVNGFAFPDYKEWRKGGEDAVVPVGKYWARIAAAAWESGGKERISYKAIISAGRNAEGSLDPVYELNTTFSKKERDGGALKKWYGTACAALNREFRKHIVSTYLAGNSTQIVGVRF